MLFLSMENNLAIFGDMGTVYAEVSNTGICEYPAYSVSMDVPGLVLVLLVL